MCENETCEYPFGHDELQFVKEDNEINSDEEVSCMSKLGKRFASVSLISADAWSDIEKLKELHESEDSVFACLDEPKIKYDKKRLEEHIVNDAEIQKNVQDIQGLTRELNCIEQDADDSEIIKNEKWIKKLMTLQGLSGKRLLKKQEIELLKHEKPIQSGGELKIDIETNKDNISSINIQITHKDDGKITTEEVT